MIDNIYNQIQQYNNDLITESELKQFINYLLHGEKYDEIARRIGITKNQALYIMTSVIYKSDLMFGILENEYAHYMQLAEEAVKSKGDDDWYFDTLPSGELHKKPNVVQLKRDELSLKFSLHRLGAYDKVRQSIMEKRINEGIQDKKQNIVLSIESFTPNDIT